MDVHIEDQQAALTLNHSQIESIVREVIKEEQQLCDEVYVHFVDSDQISLLHATYFQDPSPTDTISFPIAKSDEGGYCVLGEVFVCPETAIHYTEENGGDPFCETVLYLIHGLLHLMGYEDKEKNSEKKMRNAEKNHLANLRKKELLK